jgi:hypothetical protein
MRHSRTTTAAVPGVEKVQHPYPKGKRLLERPGHRWENHIKMDLKKQDLNWIQVIQDRVESWVLVSMAMNL